MNNAKSSKKLNQNEKASLEGELEKFKTDKKEMEKILNPEKSRKKSRPEGKLLEKSQKKATQNEH